VQSGGYEEKSLRQRKTMKHIGKSINPMKGGKDFLGNSIFTVQYSVEAKIYQCMFKRAHVYLLILQQSSGHMKASKVRTSLEGVPQSENLRKK